MKFGEAARFAKGEAKYTMLYEAYARNRDVDAEYKVLASPMARPHRYRQRNWSASSFGRCPREHQLTYLGFKKEAPSDKMMNIFSNGDYVHLRHQAFGLVAGYILEVEVPVRLDAYRLRGTMDGLLIDEEGLEIKSINPYGFEQVKTFGPKKEHVKQVHAYMLATGLKAFRIIYENKADNTIKEFLVLRDESIIEEIKAELDLLNQAVDQSKLLPMKQGCIDKDSTEYRQCPFRSNCPSAVFPEKRLIRLPSPKPSLARSS